MQINNLGSVCGRELTHSCVVPGSWWYHSKYSGDEHLWVGLRYCPSKKCFVNQITWKFIAFLNNWEENRTSYIIAFEHQSLGFVRLGHWFCPMGSWLNQHGCKLEFTSWWSFRVTKEWSFFFSNAMLFPLYQKNKSMKCLWSHHHPRLMLLFDKNLSLWFWNRLHLMLAFCDKIECCK